MRYPLVMLYGTLALFLWVLVLVTPAVAEVSISIGINIPVYPELVVVPDYPVYYARGLEVNLFFFDGLYWVYQGDNWYASSWYNGPWVRYGPEVVPVFILRIPVSYYRHPPAAWAGWSRSAPPRWGQHWGREWEQRRSGWDQWDRRTRVEPAPLPVYQRQYSGDRYPRAVEQQQTLHNQNYRHQPQDPVVRQHYQQQAQPQPEERRRSSPPPPSKDAPSAPRSQPEGVQKPAPAPPQQGGLEPDRNPRVQRPPQAQREAPKPQVQEKELRGKETPQQSQQERKQQPQQERKQQPQQGSEQEQEKEKGQGHKP